MGEHAVVRTPKGTDYCVHDCDPVQYASVMAFMLATASATSVRVTVEPPWHVKNSPQQPWCFAGSSERPLQCLVFHPGDVVTIATNDASAEPRNVAMDADVSCP
jgi:hypothetical protein